MKHPFKPKHPSKDQPSPARRTPPAAPLKDLSDADLKHVQGAAWNLNKNKDVDA